MVSHQVDPIFPAHLERCSNYFGSSREFSQHFWLFESTLLILAIVTCFYSPWSEIENRWLPPSEKGNMKVLDLTLVFLLATHWWHKWGIIPDWTVSCGGHLDIVLFLWLPAIFLKQNTISFIFKLRSPVVTATLKKHLTFTAHNAQLVSVDSPSFISKSLILCAEQTSTLLGCQYCYQLMFVL